MNINIRNVRTSDTEKIIRINVDTWRSAYSGIIDENTLRNLSYSDKLDRWRKRIETLDDKTGYFVAEVNNDLVGFVLTTQQQEEPTKKSARYEGELNAIYVSENFQRKGIGTSLVLKVVDYLTKNDINSMCVWTLKDNPYSNFYVKLGAELFDSKPYIIDQKEYPLVAYGWKDIKTQVRLRNH